MINCEYDFIQGGFYKIVSGRKIKELRRSLKMTQLEVIEATGLSHNTLSNWERGVSNPRYSEYQEVMDYLMGQREKRRNMPKLEDYMLEKFGSKESFLKLNPFISKRRLSRLIKNECLVDPGLSVILYPKSRGRIKMVLPYE